MAFAAQWRSPLDGNRNRRAAADTGLREHRNVLAHAAGFVCARPAGGWGEVNLALVVLERGFVPFGVDPFYLQMSSQDFE
jgi:hypothetical protein